MLIESTGYRATGYFSPLILDYLDEKPGLRHLYHRFPTLENLRLQAEEKSAFFPKDRRELLVSILRKQYGSLTLTSSLKTNLDALLAENTFTVTTGHQLSLFTGPAYFIYKIVTTIRLAEELSAAYSGKNFVPVYWMATEDHDFEEIAQFNFHGKKFRWNREDGGATGRMDLRGLDQIFERFSKEAGNGRNADELRRLFEETYLSGGTLAEATRKLVHTLFGGRGLIILDGDDHDLKKEFAPWMVKELKDSFSHEAVTSTTATMGDYKTQVNPREINLFYLADGVRERIVKKGSDFEVLGIDRRFTASEMQEIIRESPERISPNVILRPLYQEVILPNICYIGGGGEIAYWLQLKGMFDEAKVPFPVLLLRNSVLVATEKQHKKAQQLSIRLSDLFLEDYTLEDLAVSRVSATTVDFGSLKAQLQSQFAELKNAAHQTNPSFTGAVAAQEQKQMKGLERLEHRWRKAERRKHAEVAKRSVELRKELFPMGGLQERTVHFGDFFEKYGKDFFYALDQLRPLERNFSLLILP